MLPVVARQVNPPDIGVPPRQVLDAPPATLGLPSLTRMTSHGRADTPPENGSHPADKFVEDVPRAMNGYDHRNAPGQARRDARQTCRALRDGFNPLLFAQAPKSSSLFWSVKISEGTKLFDCLCRSAPARPRPARGARHTKTPAQWPWRSKRGARPDGGLR